MYLLNEEKFAAHFGIIAVNSDGNRMINCVCDGHNDSTASLSIKVGADGNVLVKCFAGCDQMEILNKLVELGICYNKLGETTYSEEEAKAFFNHYYLEQADFEKFGCFTTQIFQPEIHAYTISIAYPITNLDGAPDKYKFKSFHRFYVKMYGTKKRVNSATKGCKGWFNAKAMTSNSSSPLYVYGGEEKIILLDKLGVDAVSMSKGEELELSYINSINDICGNREIRIIFDNDDQFQKFFNKAAANFLIAKFKMENVYVIDWSLIPPFEGNDINDYIKSGGTIEQFTKCFIKFTEMQKKIENELICASFGNIITANELSVKEIRMPEYIIDGILPEGLTLLAAIPKIGKTTLSYQMADAISNGRAIWGRKVKQQKILVMQYEMCESLNKQFIEKIDINSDNIIFALPPKIRMNEEGVEILKMLLKQPSMKDVGLIILDTLGVSIDKRYGIGSAYDIDGTALQPLRAFVNETGVNVLALHHTRKDKRYGTDLESVSGSNAITGTVDSIMLMKGEENANEIEFKLASRSIGHRQFALTRDVKSQLTRWEIIEK